MNDESSTCFRDLDLRDCHSTRGLLTDEVETITCIGRVRIASGHGDSDVRASGGLCSRTFGRPRTLARSPCFGLHFNSASEYRRATVFAPFSIMARKDFGTTASGDTTARLARAVLTGIGFRARLFFDPHTRLRRKPEARCNRIPVTPFAPLACRESDSAHGMLSGRTSWLRFTAHTAPEASVNVPPSAGQSTRACRAASS